MYFRNHVILLYIYCLSYPEFESNSDHVYAIFSVQFIIYCVFSDNMSLKINKALALNLNQVINGLGSSTIVSL